MAINERMLLIQKCFQEGREIAAASNSIENLANIIDKYPIETQSIVLEGASMQVALQSLKIKNSLSGWNNFYTKCGIKFSSQAHIGVGWALAELNLSVSPYILNIDKENQWRVLDGYGYYFALFKRRVVLREQRFPEQLSKDQEGFYTQGVGRCLWYLSKGDLNKLSSMIIILKTWCLADLWRGIGIAVAYVGLIDKLEVEKLKTLSGNHAPSFLCGILLAASSSVKSGCSYTESQKIAAFLFTDSKHLIKQLIIYDKERGGEGFDTFEKNLLLD